MYNKIIEGMTKTFDNIELNDYHKMNKSVSNLNRYKMSISIPDSYINKPNIEEIYISTFIKEVQQSIDKNLVKELEKSSLIIDYINLIGLNEVKSTNCILDLIVRSGYSNCITTSKICSMLRDSIISQPTNWTSLYKDGLISSNISKIGNFNNVDIYVDYLIKYNEDVIILFNKHDINFELNDMSFYKEDFSTNLAIDYNFGFNIIDSKIYYTIEDTYSKHYNQIISRNRDKKIDYILDIKNKKE
jgi:hypothetical protein